MSGVALHSLQRSLGKLTLGLVKDREAHLDEIEMISMVEGEQQFQIPVAGIARAEQVWQRVDLDFDFHFYNATGQRDSPYEKPQVWHGFVFENRAEEPEKGPVSVSVAVDWQDKIDGRDVISGAAVWIGVHSPTLEERPFKGYVHVTFQGLGSRVETEVNNE